MDNGKSMADYEGMSAVHMFDEAQRNITIAREGAVGAQPGAQPAETAPAVVIEMQKLPAAQPAVVVPPAVPAISVVPAVPAAAPAMPAIPPIPQLPVAQPMPAIAFPQVPPIPAIPAAIPAQAVAVPASSVLLPAVPLQAPIALQQV